MMVWKMFLLFQGCIFRFHVNLARCIPPTFLLDHLIIGGKPTRKTEKSHRITLAETWTKAMPLVGLLISKAALNDDKKNKTSGVWQFGDVFFPCFGSVGQCLKWLPDVGYIYISYILNGMSMSKWGGWSPQQQPGSAGGMYIKMQSFCWYTLCTFSIQYLSLSCLAAISQHSTILSYNSSRFYIVGYTSQTKVTPTRPFLIAGVGKIRMHHTHYHILRLGPNGLEPSTI